MRRAGGCADHRLGRAGCPQAVGDFLILRAVRDSGGYAMAVSDQEITEGLAEVAQTEGLLALPGRRRHLGRLQAISRRGADRQR